MPKQRLFLCGDVMLGRGIDQIQRRPSEPRLHEAYAQSALDYVQLAEQADGRMPRAVDPHYVWGEALRVLHSRHPAASIVNLETAITTSDDYCPKGINYRMHPGNVGVLTAARIDCCVLANNHVMDWGTRGLLDTLSSLREAGIRVAGAGRNASEAAAPAVIPLREGGRVLVFGMASTTSGVPATWAAAADQPGVHLLPDLSARTASSVVAAARSASQQGDVLIASVHWGGNWGHDVPRSQQDFAHLLVDGGFTVVHGHSSHHPKGIEPYGGGVIFYGCGDFINDYEGISGYETFRGDLTMMYLLEIDPGGQLASAVDMVPLQMRRFRLERPTQTDVDWLYRTFAADCGVLGTRVAKREDGEFRIELRQD